MVAHQYDDKGRSTRASGSEDPQSTDNTPQPLPKKTRYSLRSVQKSKEIPQAHAEASGLARQISEHEDDDVMVNNMDQMDVDRMDEIDDDRPPNTVQPYAKYTVNHIFSKPSIDFYKNPLIEDLIMENLVTLVEVM